MVACEVCGNEEFEKHAGFLYCAVCQTQSQDYHEQEYEYSGHKLNIIRRKKSQTTSMKTKKAKFYDDGMWTTWEVFNYILHGMTEEIKRCGVSGEFESMVFKLWAAYLKECQAVFISKYEEKLPKLGFNFKHRDARILYNMDVSSNPLLRRRKSRSKSCESGLSYISHSTMFSQSKRSIALQRGKLIASDYQDHLSLSLQNNYYSADETLESLGKSSDLETTCESSDNSESMISSFKQILRKEDFKLLKSSYHSERLLARAKVKCKRDVKLPGKNKLLSIIHLALLMTGSEIQLSDLLRFIREGHLSFAKVTHFFPKDMKLPKKDFSYVEVTSDSLMPTHLRQRKIAGPLACLLKVDEIPAANMDLLVDRYCEELNLPEQVGKLSKKVVRGSFPSTIVPKRRSAFPSCEAAAVSSIVFVMKLLFGLNDRTEIFLSHLAREVNSLETTDHLLFVFEDWQKYIECRKSVLSKFHYPTMEQLKANPFQNSKKFLGLMMKESKDEYRNERFVPYSDYYIEEKLLDGVKQVLNSLSKPQDVTSLEFHPSLTPQISNLQIVMRDLLRRGEGGEKNGCGHLSELSVRVLKQSFKNCDLNFAFDPESCSNLLRKESSDLLRKLSAELQLPWKGCLRKFERKVNSLTDCSSVYWSMRYPKVSSGQLRNFREVFEETPKNFQWLMTECAKMLEMNVRDIYEQLLNLEEKFSSEE